MPKFIDYSPVLSSYNPSAVLRVGGQGSYRSYRDIAAFSSTQAIRLRKPGKRKCVLKERLCFEYRWRCLDEEQEDKATATIKFKDWRTSASAAPPPTSSQLT